MKKQLILSCLAVFSLVTVAGCASEERHTSSTSESSAMTMTPDSKDMVHRDHTTQ